MISPCKKSINKPINIELDLKFSLYNGEIKTSFGFNKLPIQSDESIKVNISILSVPQLVLSMTLPICRII